MTSAWKPPKYNFSLLETPDTALTPSRGHLTASGTPINRFSTPRRLYPAGDSSTSSSVAPRSRSSSTSSVNIPSSTQGSARARTPRSARAGTSGSVQAGTAGSSETPSTSSSSTPREEESSVIIAVTEGRGQARGEVGIACMDLRTPVLVVSQFCDTATYVTTMTKLQMYNPIEIILPHTAGERGSMTNLFKLINDNFVGSSISTIQRKYFNETKGLQMIKQLRLPEMNTLDMDLASKYYCLSAAAALMKYVEFIQNIMFAPESLKVIFKGSENTTMIDASTARSLELVENIKDPRSRHSLYGILNFTKTVGGARFLRANILQPPCDLDTITLRQDAVTELTENEELFCNLQVVLGRFLDIDHLLSLCIQIPKQETVRIAERKITHIIYLKHTLELVEPLSATLEECINPLFRAFRQTLQDERFGIIMEKIKTVIHDDTRYQKGTLSMRTQKCFAVKPNINGMLDIARRAYTEIVDDIAEITKQLGEKFSLPLKTGYNTCRGFFLQLYCGGKNPYSADDLPGIFVKKVKYRNMLNFTTFDLIKLNDRAKESLREIYLMTNVVVTQLLSEIRDHVGCLYKLTDAVSVLDTLVSFAHACTVSDYVRPEFTDTMAIKQGRHPILDKICDEAPVPNNTYASRDSNFLIITGPNMSGKSTYIRQMALLQVMAQIGSFVPAEYASFRIADQIFTRVRTDDDLETNASTFVLEMREVNYIMQNASHSSLIIMDELGRGTSCEEGVGICHAICEYLLNLRAFTFFVTHFMELTNLPAMYPNAENYHFQVKRLISADGNCDKVIFSHILSKGKTEEIHYGLRLAEISTMPKAVVDDAKRLSKMLEEEEEKNKNNLSAETLKEQAMFRLATRLIQTARNSRLEEESLRAYLKTLKKQYLKEIEEAEKVAER